MPPSRLRRRVARSLLSSSRTSVLGLLSLLVCAPAACSPGTPRCGEGATDVPTGAARLHVLSYNIGNPRKKPPYAHRLSDRRYERALAGTLATMAPDLVFLQEVLSPAQCEGMHEPDPERSCFDAQHDAPQVRRILGDDYSIVCDQNRQTECIGVHRSFGTIRGLAAGALDLTGATTEPLPGKACHFDRGECTPRSDRCDAESTVSSVLVDTAQGPVRLVHVHPTAIGHRCLQRQVMQAFELTEGSARAIVAGDWNFDPSLATDLVPASIWNEWVGEHARFVDHSPRDESCQLARTFVAQDTSLDRVVSDFAVGTCRVWDGPRLDDEAEQERKAGDRIDHYAVDCALHMEGP